MKIIIFDTETTGLPIRDAGIEKQPYIIQFASLTFDYNPLTKHFVECARYDQLIKPPISVPSESTRICGISDADVSNKPSFSELYTEISQLFHESDIAIAHNLEFDRLMLINEIQRLGKTGDLMPAETYDTMEKTRNLCKLPGRGYGYKSPKLMELHHFLLSDGFMDAHNAIKDVEALSRCVNALLQNGYYTPQPRAKVTPVNTSVAEQFSLF